MKKFIIGLVALASLVGCGLEQKDCLEEGKFEFQNECVPWVDIPLEEREEVILEVAEGIAEERGISEEQALWEVLDYLENLE